MASRIHADTSHQASGYLRLNSLPRYGAPELDGLLVEDVLESEEEGCCKNALGDLGSNTLKRLLVDESNLVNLCRFAKMVNKTYPCINQHNPPP